MKYTIREGVWETNSSSVHSISISNKGLRKCRLKPREDGYIHVRARYFGRELKYYPNQKDKLTYLMVCVAYCCGSRYGCADDEQFYDDYRFKCIEEAVRHYYEETTDKHDCLGIRVDNLEKAELDHQSIPEYGDLPFVDVWDEVSIQNFIFNSYISLKTDGD